jgi:hypothetical protein
MNPHKRLLHKFLETNSKVRELLDIYLFLRQHFQELGFSQKDLENPPIYTTGMMNSESQFTHRKNALLKQIKDYGFEINDDDLVSYLQPLLNKIDELTPLSHVDYKRRNQGDEDSE